MTLAKHESFLLGESMCLHCLPLCPPTTKPDVFIIPVCTQVVHLFVHHTIAH